MLFTSDRNLKRFGLHPDQMKSLMNFGKITDKFWTFSVTSVSAEVVVKVIKDVPSQKANSMNIRVNVLKQCGCTRQWILSWESPTQAKKGEPTDDKIIGPDSVLPLLSKFSNSLL